MSTSGLVSSLELALTSVEALGIPPKAITSSREGCTGTYVEQSIKDKDNVGIILLDE
jgi:hypothetical protein